MQATVEEFLTQLAADKGDFVFLVNAWDATAENDAKAAGDELERVLDRTIGQLKDDEELTDLVRLDRMMKAIAVYVASIWPKRKEAGLGLGFAFNLARENDVYDRLPPFVKSKFQDEGLLDAVSTASETQQSAPQEEDADAADADLDEEEEPDDASVSAEEDEGDDAVNDDADDPETAEDPVEQDAIEQGAADEPRGFDDDEADEEDEDDPEADLQNFFEVNYEQLLDVIFKSRARGTRIVVMLGLKTAGKTFFVRRLCDSLERHFLKNYAGTAFGTNEITDRTKGVSYYGIHSEDPKIAKNSPERSIELFDLPGEWFNDLAGEQGKDRQSAEQVTDAMRKMLCAILCAADSCIIVEPAIRVLTPEEFKTQGDYASPIDEAWDAAKAQAEEAKREAAADRLEGFHNSLQNVRQRVLNLRRMTSGALLQGDREAFSATIDGYLKTEFQDLETINDPLPIPGLLLLSRTDDYAATAFPGQSNYAKDPALQLASTRKYESYSVNFEVFAVDFITACKAQEPDGEEEVNRLLYSKERDHAGVTGMLDDWLLPAMEATRIRSFFGRPMPRLARKFRNSSNARKRRMRLDAAFKETMESPK